MNHFIQSKRMRKVFKLCVSNIVVSVMLSGMAVANPGRAQGTIVPVSANPMLKMELGKALKLVETSQKAKFIFSRDFIDLTQIVTFSESKSNLNQVLHALFDGLNIKFEILDGNQIVLIPGRTTNETISLDKDEIVVRGKVTSNKGEPLPGVSIRVKNTPIGGSTDIHGSYSVKVPGATGVLVFSYMGFISQEIVINSRSQINVVLVEDIKSLEEVIVVGYGTMKKKDVTGATARVGSKEIEKMPAQNALQAMQGRAAGVDITSNNRPGQLGSIRVRGNRSLMASNEPLYVVDGIPLAYGGIDAISPHDIESIDVLKDASATAIFGSRGANGVVLVTTKRGSAGKAQLNYNGITTFETLWDMDEVFNSGDYAELRRNAYRAYPVGNVSRYTTLYPDPVQDKRILGTDPVAWENIAKGYTWIDKANLIPQMRATTAAEAAKWGVSEVPVYDGSLIPTTDWGSMVIRTGITQDHTLSTSLGSETVNAYLSGGILDQKGTNIDQSFRRYNFKTSIDAKPTKWMSLGGSINATFAKQNYGYQGGGTRGASGIYAAARGMLPFAQPYDENGEFIFQPGGDINITNPILEGDNLINERTTSRILGSFYSEINFGKGIKYRMNFGPDFRNYRSGEFQDAKSVLRGGGAPSSTNYARLQQSQNVAWTLDNLLYYDKDFGKHHLNLTLLQSSTYNRTESSNMAASNLPYTSQLWYNLQSTSNGKLDAYGSGFVKNTLLSYMGRVNYSFADKYLITFAGRWDGASPLADDNKWDFFPSAALGWRMEQEPFLKDVQWVSQLKPRLGLGVTGNSAISPYSTLGGLTQIPITFGTKVSIGYTPSDPKAANPALMPNKDLKWEKTTQLNAGVDFGFLRDRIRGSIDIYTSRTKDLILPRNVPSVVGYTQIAFNIGETSNRGIDFMLSTTNITGKDFRWDTDLTLSTSKDKVVSLALGKQDMVSNRFFINQPLFVYYDYKKTGIWQTADADEIAKYAANGMNCQPGDIKVQDQNGDYKIESNNDMVIIGNRYPRWTTGLTNTFNYKGFELSFFLYGRFGFWMEGGAVGMQGRFQSRKVDYWTPDNPTNAYPRADYRNGDVPTYYSSMNYQKGDFVKIRNVSFGYAIPTKVLNKIRVKNLKVYGQLLNPYMWTKNGFMDPDVYSNITSRSYVIGVNATF